MKVALISDIHANLAALDAVLEDINRLGVDQVVCLGDMVTLGPSPRETLDRIKALNCPCIIGNHEQAVFSPLDAARYEIKGNLTNTIGWCVDQLSADDMAFLKAHSLPSLSITLDAGKEMFCYHGSPDSTIEGIYPNTPTVVLDRLFAGLGKSVVLAAGGHTHEPMIRQHRGLLIVNPGSVGCAFDVPLASKVPPSYLPLAEYGIVECGNSGVAVTLRQIPFDVRAFASAVHVSGLPLKDWWDAQFERLGV